MPTDVGLVNEALVELGQTPIVALNGTDEISIACNTIYADTRDAVLLLYPWRFATYQIGLPLSAYPPVFKWAHQYALPDGTKYGGAPYCLRIVSTSEGASSVSELAQHTVDGRILYAHPLTLGTAQLDLLAATPYAIEYIGRVTELALWDFLALRVLVKMLASTLAKAMTGQTALADEKLKEALALLPPAKEEQDDQTQAVGIYPSIDFTETEHRVMNQVLSLVGQPSIRSPLEATVRAQEVRKHFATARDAVLTMHPWNFAKCQATLGLHPTYEPPMRYRYAYDLPDGVKYDALPYCLRVLELAHGCMEWETANNMVQPDLLGTLGGKVLLTNMSSAVIEYVGLIPNLAIWSPLAIQGLIYTLASAVAIPLAKAPQLAIAYAQQAAVIAKEARRQDAKEGTPPFLRPNTNVWAARMGGRQAAWRGGYYMPPVTTSTNTGREYGTSNLTVTAVDNSGALIATGLLPANARISTVIYHCTVAFGTSRGLISVDIGDSGTRNRWGTAVGITLDTETDYSDGLPGDLATTIAQDVYVSANGGNFDTIGACVLTAIWERVELP